MVVVVFPTPPFIESIAMRKSPLIGCRIFSMSCCWRRTVRESPGFTCPDDTTWTARRQPPCGASVDEAARARHLMAQSMGALLVDVVLHPPDDWSDSGAILRAYVERALIPATELAVHGVMADETLLDAVLTYRNEHTTQES